MALPTAPTTLFQWDTANTNTLVGGVTSGHQANGWAIDEIPTSTEENTLLANWSLWLQLLKAWYTIASTAVWFWEAPGAAILASSGGAAARGSDLSVTGAPAAGATALVALSSKPVGTIVSGAAFYFTGIGHGTGGTTMTGTLYIRSGTKTLTAWGAITQTDPAASSTLYTLTPNSGMANYVLSAGEHLVFEISQPNNGDSLDTIGVQIIEP